MGAGDLLPYFGLFQPVVRQQAGASQYLWQFDKTQPARHCLWGWMQIDSCHSVANFPAEYLAWAHYHPHFFSKQSPNNTLYLAARELTLDGHATGLPGSGCLPYLRSDFVLTDSSQSKLTQWRLPRALYPEPGKPALSYHSKPERWQSTRKTL